MSINCTDKEGLEEAVKTIEEILEGVYSLDPYMPDPEELKEKTEASLGNAELCIKLGNDYYYGESRFDQDQVKAVYWYEKAAEECNQKSGGEYYS